MPKILSYYRSSGMFWVRIFGRGFSVKDVNVHPLLFSERYGHTKTLRIGKWSIKSLK